MSGRDPIDARAEQHEQPFIVTFLEWVAALKLVALIIDVLESIRSGTWALLQAAFQPVARPRLNLLPAALDEAERSFQEALAAAGHTFPARFDARDPLLQLSVDQAGGRDIGMIDAATREAVRLTVQDAHRSNWQPHVFAPQLHAMIGLTPQQAKAVVNLTNAQLADGVKPEVVAARAERYAARLLKQRATLIARTESVRAANLGRLAAFQQAAANGLVPRDSAFLEWSSVQTDPAEICFQLNGKRVPLEESSFNGLLPPVHPNCFPAGTIVSGPRAVGSVERWYEGEIVHIRSRNHELTCTPNHPILTDQGWVPAGLLRDGDQLVCAALAESVPAIETGVAGVAEEDQVPSTIEDVVRSLADSPGVATSSIPVSADDFHGDATEGDVAVVSSDRLLDHRVDAAFSQPVGNQDRGRGSVELARLSGESGSDKALLAARAASLGDMSVDRLTSSLLGSHHGPLGALSFRSSSEVDSGASEVASDSVSAAAELIAQVREASSAPVLLDDVVAIDWKPFSGHVYNLETRMGWYMANGIVVHNCRCVVQLVVA